MSNEIKKNNMIDPNISITQYFINQPFLEIKGESDSEFNALMEQAGQIVKRHYPDLQGFD